MFLRIDKVTGVDQRLNPSGNPTPSNDSLHACLATSSSTVDTRTVGNNADDNNNDNNDDSPTVIPDDTANATGELFIVGRKGVSVTIDDKVRYIIYYILLRLLSFCLPPPQLTMTPSLSTSHQRQNLPQTLNLSLPTLIIITLHFIRCSVYHANTPQSICYPNHLLYNNNNYQKYYQIVS